MGTKLYNVDLFCVRQETKHALTRSWDLPIGRFVLFWQWKLIKSQILSYLVWIASPLLYLLAGLSDMLSFSFF
jgi:hypothetical protein